MRLNIGTKIRELRFRDGRTQEALAAALGVTSQAVSRWEANGSYPDMEIIPAIANYFGITIDELFGYQNNRDIKIDKIIDRVDSFHIKIRGDDEWVDECIAILREGLAEFPQNDRLLITLADTLSEAGWRRHKEWLYYDDEGFIQYSYDRHRKNEYWSEAVKICENLLETATDNTIVIKAITILVLLHRNFGDKQKAISYAMRMPALTNSREVMLALASDGKEQAKYVGEFLLEAASAFAEQLVYGLITNCKHYDSDLPIEKVKGAIEIFTLICDDGNLGLYHDDVSKLNLYLSRLQWERGYYDEAFESLEAALDHAKAYDACCDGKEHALTAPLVSFVRYKADTYNDMVRKLPEDWPFWCNPEYKEVEREIKKDPRWQEWVEKTKE